MIYFPLSCLTSSALRTQVSKEALGISICSWPTVACQACWAFTKTALQSDVKLQCQKTPAALPRELKRGSIRLAQKRARCWVTARLLSPKLTEIILTETNVDNKPIRLRLPKNSAYFNLSNLKESSAEFSVNS